MREHHGRTAALSCLQRLSEAIGAVVQAKEADWEYALPELEETVATVSVGLDGTCLLLGEDGWREAMVGTVALFDAEGRRQHTIYTAAPPEYGKSTFLGRLEREVERVRRRYPDATYIGLADGAKSHWRFLQSRTDVQLIDFYHAASYLQAVAEAAFPQDKAKRQQWFRDRRHRLKHEPGAAKSFLDEMKALPTDGLNQRQREALESAITYFYYHHQMDYATALKNHWPIGSGVTEAACKTLVKQRLCRSGMRWKEKGAAVVLSLRALMLTGDRWQQFWNKIDQFGLPVAV